MSKILSRATPAARPDFPWGARPRMILILWAGLMAAMSPLLRAQEITPKMVAILFNSNDKESAELAEYYRNARGIPEENLLGLPMPAGTNISRGDFNSKILEPLKAAFIERDWWRMGEDANGLALPVGTRIPVLAIMRGVPMKINDQKDPNLAVAEGDPIGGRSDASVDSELYFGGVSNITIHGALPNQYFNNQQRFLGAGMSFILLTSRIDAVSVTTCRRMIDDAVAVEATGLWGRAYVDVANKFPDGDHWMKEAARASAAAGIPTVVDNFNETFPVNYPMTDASLYYGWYDANLSGPFLNPGMTLKRGAVALHLHSFSAAQLRDPSKNWSAGLLEKGAAVTIGNVGEPYLQVSHNFNVINDRLLRGWTWAEASWAGMPAASWQSIALGDPLYRPFTHLDGGGKVLADDRDFRALRVAMAKWGDQPIERNKQLTAAAERLSSGTLIEALGLEALTAGNTATAAREFKKARGVFKVPADQLRQDLHLAAIARGEQKRAEALEILRGAAQRYGKIPSAAAVEAWIQLLDPPAPPPVKP